MILSNLQEGTPIGHGPFWHVRTAPASKKEPIVKQTAITKRLAGQGSDKWEIYYRAQEMRSKGIKVIDLSIGAPDVPTPPPLVEALIQSIQSGRTGYSDGAGELGLRKALAYRYTQRTGMPVTPENILCFPGTQTALFAAMMGVAETGSEVLVADPYYISYEAVIRATGANMVTFPLYPEHGFRPVADDIAARITDRTEAILLNTPHNPTGTILSEEELHAICALAKAHDLWIVCDEVYEDLIFENARFYSPLAEPEMQERVVIVSSISKSHAAAGFRSGWCIGPAQFIAQLLPFSETMLFGNQPFIADMTQKAIEEGSTVAADMARRYQRNARALGAAMQQAGPFAVHPPKAGMFALMDISATDKGALDFARDLLSAEHVAVMPGDVFGSVLKNWVRVGLTLGEEEFDIACERLTRHARANVRG